MHRGFRAVQVLKSIPLRCSVRYAKRYHARIHLPLNLKDGNLEGEFSHKIVKNLLDYQL